MLRLLAKTGANRLAINLTGRVAHWKRRAVRREAEGELSELLGLLRPRPGLIEAGVRTGGRVQGRELRSSRHRHASVQPSPPPAAPWGSSRPHSDAEHHHAGADRQREPGDHLDDERPEAEQQPRHGEHQ